MTVHHDLDRVLADWFDDTAPQLAPAGLRDEALTGLGSTRQRPRWLAGLRSPDAPDHRGALGGLSVRLVGAAVVFGLLLTMAAVVVGSRPAVTTPLPALPTTAPPEPSRAPTQFGAFVVPFEVTLPVEGDWRRGKGSAPELIAWLEGPEPSEHGGITMASTSNAWAHGCHDGQNTERFALGPKPADFLAGLRDEGGVGLGPIEPTTLDGYAALVADIDPGKNRCESRDVHVKGPIEGLSADGCCASLEDPARIIAADIDGQPIFILIWARTTDDLAAIVPMATEFVHSIRFRMNGGPTSVDDFVMPFDAVLPEDGRMQIDRGPYRELVDFAIPADDVGGIAGVTLAWGDQAQSHECVGGNDGPRFELPAEPSRWIAALGDRAGARLSDVSATTVDGREAVGASLEQPARGCSPDVHLNGPDLSMDDYLLLTSPSRLIVTQVEGRTILIRIWARTADDLATFLPMATQFVDSIHFR